MENNELNLNSIYASNAKMVYCNWSIPMSTNSAETIIREKCCGIFAAWLHRSSVHEQKKFWTSNVPDFLRHPLLSKSETKYPQSLTTRTFPKTEENMKIKKFKALFKEFDEFNIIYYFFEKFFCRESPHYLANVRGEF